MVQNVNSDDSFCQELIRRFFHPKSYFHHCISHHLDTLIKNDDIASGEEYLLFSSLLDRLVASENKVQELRAVSKIDGFDNLHENLTNKIIYLRDSDLTPEQLKIEIERLAQSMIKIAVEALQHDNAKKKLKEYLGDKHNEIVDSQVKPLSDPISKLDEDKTLEITEPPSEVPGNAEPEQTQQSTPGFSELDKIEEKEILQSMDAGRDASSEHGSDSDLDREGGSVNIDAPNKDQFRDRVNEEPESVIRVFLTEIELQLKQLQETLALLSSDSRNKSHWLDCSKILENIKANAMIYGFEDFEQIAQKAMSLISQARALKIPHPPVLALLNETVNFLNRMIQGDVERLDEKLVMSFIQKLKNPEESLGKEKIESQENHSITVKKNSQSDEIESKESTTQPNQPEKAINEIPIPQKEIKETSDFKLPGEDDEEILNLVREISKNKPKENSLTHDFSESGESPSLAAIEKSEKQTIKNQEPEHPSTEIIGPSVDDQLKAFKEEADLYFSVIEDALKTLEAQPENTTAMDDLELASYSLYALTLKMNLEPLGELPASIEGLIKDKNSKKSSLSGKERQVIKEAYQQFRKLTRIEESEKRHFKELLASVQELNPKLQLNPCMGQHAPFSLQE